MSGQFWRSIWPVLEQAMWPGAALASTEMCACPVCKMLDRRAAIDGLILQPSGAVEPFAARIQPDDGWRTFTVRRAIPSGGQTEFDKLNHWGSLVPTWHIHAYTPSARGNGAIGVVESAALTHAMLALQIEIKQNRADGTLFSVVPWNRLGSLVDVIAFPMEAIA